MEGVSPLTGYSSSITARDSSCAQALADKFNGLGQIAESASDRDIVVWATNTPTASSGTSAGPTVGGNAGGSNKYANGKTHLKNREASLREEYIGNQAVTGTRSAAELPAGVPRLMAITEPNRRSAALVTPADVARTLHVSAAWVRDHATRKQPRLPSVKVGRLLRFRPEEIEDWIRKQSKGVA
jgi:predicted DNA-binding transcriptional regulator AlpA